METIIGIDLGTTNSEVAVIKDGRPSSSKRTANRSCPRSSALTPRADLLVGKAGPQPVRSGAGTDHPVDQAKDGPGGHGRPGRPEILPAGNLGDHPADAQAARGEGAGPCGLEGRDHRARVLQRRPAAGHSRGGRARRAGGRSHHQRADRRRPDLRPSSHRDRNGCWSTTWAAARSMSRWRRSRTASSRSWPATAIPSSAATTSISSCSTTSAIRSARSTAIDLRQSPTSRSRLLHAVEEAKKRLSFDAVTSIEEEFIAEQGRTCP